MLMDALMTVSRAQDLTTIAGAATGYSDTIDLSQSRDIGTAGVPIFSIFTTLPTSATGGATVTWQLQTSADNSTWTTIEATAAVPISTVIATAPFLFRGTVPAGVLRYLRVAITPSAALTAGALTTSIGADWPRSKSYPKNYVS